MLCIFVGISAIVKCSQTGKFSHVTLQHLSLPSSDPLSRSKLTRGVDLFFEYEGKSYPVQFIGYQGLHICMCTIGLGNVLSNKQRALSSHHYFRIIYVFSSYNQCDS